MFEARAALWTRALRSAGTSSNTRGAPDDGILLITRREQGRSTGSSGVDRQTAHDAKASSLTYATTIRPLEVLQVEKYSRRRRRVTGHRRAADPTG